MTNLHKIRARIRSVNSTQQITRTMKMIAVSKLRRTQTSLAGVRLFADKSQAVLNALLAGDASFEHPYLTPRRHVGRVCYVVFWGNRGLCGAYNQLLLRHLEGLVRAEARPCSVIVCGRWGRDVLAGTDLPVRQIFSDLSDTPTMAEALEIAEELKNLYRTGEADEIHLVYQHFDSVLHQTPTHRQLLPAAPEADAPAANNNYLFVPDAQTVLDNVLELYLNNTVYAVMLEARVGEHAARMTAMTAATDSTAELIEDLNLEFNRARQAAITTEISEIVGGSAALIEWAFFYVFSEAAGINYLASTACAYFLSTLYHYFMCNILVFTSGVRYGKAKEISIVFLVSGMRLLFNLILMYVFVGLFALPGLLSKIAATCIVVVWNYLARKKWIF